MTHKEAMAGKDGKSGSDGGEGRKSMVSKAAQEAEVPTARGKLDLMGKESKFLAEQVGELLGVILLLSLGCF